MCILQMRKLRTLGAEILESESNMGNRLTFSASTLRPLLPSHCFLVEWLWANNCLPIEAMVMLQAGSLCCHIAAFKKVLGLPELSFYMEGQSEGL